MLHLKKLKKCLKGYLIKMIIDKNSDVIVIVGPTSVGKTKLAIEIAKEHNGEVISGDAYQVYRKMDIGTAKVTEAEMQGVVHHLIDIIDYQDNYNVQIFQKQARKLIEDIKKRGKLPIIAGGTGLYVQSVLFNYEFGEDPQYQELKIKNEAKSLAELQEIITNSNIKLNSSDFNNHKRLVVVATKVMLNKPLNSNAKKPFYDKMQMIGLTTNREILYERINKRVDLMIEQGLFNEVQQFKPNYQSQEAIGYKEIHRYFNGELTKEEAIDLIKQNSRRFAKRQYTWYRNKMPEIVWYQYQEEKWQLVRN